MTDPANAARQAMALLTQGAGPRPRERARAHQHWPDRGSSAEKLHPARFELADEILDHRSAEGGRGHPRLGAPAAGQSATEAGKLATGVSTPLAGLPAAGYAAGSGLATGVSTGISSKAGAAIAQARALVAQVKAMAAPVGQHRPGSGPAPRFGGGLCAALPRGLPRACPRCRVPPEKS